MLTEETVVMLKKAVLVLFIILYLLLLPLLRNYKISVKATPTSPTKWTVDDDGPANFTRIQDAINSSLVTDGDIIYVYNGIYNENIIVNKTVSLIGEHRETAIIDGGGTGNVISIVVSNVSVNGFTIKKSGPLPNSGILIDPYTNGNNISNNKIIDNSQGIRFGDFSRNNIICDNNISNNGDGIILYRSSNNVVSRNVISYNDNVGISFYYPGDNSIRDNNISDNSDGIYLYSSSNNEVSGNTISSNIYYGIRLDSSGNNVFSRNVILYNDLAGMSLYSSSNNTISGNTVSSNDPYGIYLFDSNNNTVYHNNFNNTDQVSGVYTNLWDYGEEGNYWSDYAGQDQNEDGIGDSPYIIDETNQDKYPLMGIFNEFDVTLESETHHVTVVSNSTISDFKFEIGVETGNKIIRFNVTGEEGSVGFSRVTIPIELMKDPYIVLSDGVEIVPTSINVSDQKKACLYFTYFNNHAISIISSETLHLYYELLAKYTQLQEDFYALNVTCYELLTNYSKLQTDLYMLNVTYYGLFVQLSTLQESFTSLNGTYYELQANYSMLQIDLFALNSTYYGLLNTTSGMQGSLDNLNRSYYKLLSDYEQLQKDLNSSSVAYQVLLDAYSILLGNYSSLLDSFSAMNASYQKHLSAYSEQMQNFRSLIYIFVATTAVFIITTIYLSKHAHASLKKRE